ncbi:HAD-like domain-containing protein, partial [Spinellus fusiger]
PTKAYLDLSLQPFHVQPKRDTRLLVILDLNGTLVSRTGKRGMYIRPYHQQFFDYLFENFDVMVWSSARPESVENMSLMFGDYNDKLIASWNRTHFGLSKHDFNAKTKTIKDLEKVWSFLGNQYNATNTVLLDDSPQKTILQPYNAIHLKTFGHTSPSFASHGDCELIHVQRYLEQLTVDNVASFMRQQPY